MQARRTNWFYFVFFLEMNNSSSSGNTTTNSVGGSGVGGTVPVTFQVPQEIERALITKEKLKELCKEISPELVLEDEVEELLLHMVDDFIDNSTKFSCELAKHRKSNVLEVKDLQLHLERNYNIIIPGFSEDQVNN